MWFLIPSPYRVAKAFIPRGRTSYRRRCNRRPTYRQAPVTTDREKLWWSTAGLALIGICLTLGNNPASLPHYPPAPAPYGWVVNDSGALSPRPAWGEPLPRGTVSWIDPQAIQNTTQITWSLFILGLVLLAAALAAGIVLHRTARWPARYHEPPSATPPRQPQPAPLPDYPPSGPRSGHKPVPVNRELPADRPHPWRTWEG